MPHQHAGSLLSCLPVALAKAGLPAKAMARARQSGLLIWLIHKVVKLMPEIKRKLAAIMFSDIVGYTALMGSDEEHAFEVLRKNREIHKKFIDQFNGTLIKEMGDGMLFQSFSAAKTG